MRTHGAGPLGGHRVSRTVWVLAMLLATLPGLQAKQQIPEAGDVVVLTDENFDSLAHTGEWIVKIYAPWCVHCKALEPVWEKLAARVADQSIKVAKINGVEEPVLMSRFRVEGFPSIFHIKDGETREYKGGRSVHALEAFAKVGWKKLDPLPFWRSPTSAAGQFLAVFLSVPSQIQTSYTYFKHDLGYSEVAILAGALAVPLTVGIVFICLLDAFYTRRPQAYVPTAHLHQE